MSDLLALARAVRARHSKPGLLVSSFQALGDETMKQGLRRPDRPAETGHETVAKRRNAHRLAETVAERLSQLSQLSPPPAVKPLAWQSRFEHALAFEVLWGAQARALGWSDAELYSLHPTAPLARLDAMGAAFFGAGATVVEVTPEAVVLSVPPGAVIQRARKPLFAAPPTWETFGAIGRGA